MWRIITKLCQFRIWTGHRRHRHRRRGLHAQTVVLLFRVDRIQVCLMVLFGFRVSRNRLLNARYSLTLPTAVDREALEVATIAYGGIVELVYKTPQKISFLFFPLGIFVSHHIPIGVEIGAKCLRSNVYEK